MKIDDVQNIKIIDRPNSPESLVKELQNRVVLPIGRGSLFMSLNFRPSCVNRSVCNIVLGQSRGPKMQRKNDLDISSTISHVDRTPLNARKNLQRSHSIHKVWRSLIVLLQAITLLDGLTRLPDMTRAVNSWSNNRPLSLEYGSSRRSAESSANCPGRLIARCKQARTMKSVPGNCGCLASSHCLMATTFDATGRLNHALPQRRMRLA